VSTNLENRGKSGKFLFLEKLGKNQENSRFWKSQGNIREILVSGKVRKKSGRFSFLEKSGKNQGNL